MAVEGIISEELAKDFCQRLTQLRVKSGHSAQDMSLKLGLSRGYVNKIENSKGVDLPTLKVFFDICEFLRVKPAEFFDYQTPDPHQFQMLFDMMQQLDEEAREHVMNTARILSKKP